MKTEYEALITAKEMLFDPAADPDGCPGLAAVLPESMNDVLPLDEAKGRSPGRRFSVCFPQIFECSSLVWLKDPAAAVEKNMFWCVAGKAQELQLSQKTSYEH